MRIKSLMLGVGLAVCASSALAGGATTPTISGSYRFSLVTFCGLPVNPWPDGVTTEFDGEAQSDAGIFVVHSGDKTTSAGSYANTQVITPNSTGGSAQGGTFDNSKATAFSNTATSFTFQGQTYQVFYGSVNGSNVALQFEFMNTSTEGNATAPNCINWGTAVRI